MPRLTSFDSHESFPAEPGSEWRISNRFKKGLLSTKGWIAVKGNVTIELGFDGGPTRSIEISNYAYLVSLKIKEATIQFTIFPLSGYPNAVTRVYPEAVSVTPISTRLEVALKNDGKATYRPAWKDSDTGKGTLGFVDPLNFSSIEAEEAIVWLLGTLVVRGLPQIPEYGRYGALG